MLKNALKAILMALVPVLYALIIKMYPEFPLDVVELGALILWIIGLGFGGWYIRKSYEETDKFWRKRKHYSYKKAS